MHENKIDFVLPWVDSSDTSWQEDKLRYEGKYNNEDRKNSTRFRDTNTLKYVLRSIEKNCPWYHKIYLITVGHTPSWLNVSHPKIELIAHEELFIDKANLPVFNSNAIEMNLVNIKNLSEKFIYLNDDMIIWKSLKKERFFKDNKPVDFFHHAWVPRNKIFEMLKGKDTWVDAINNNIRLLHNTSFTSSMSPNQYYHYSYSLKQKISNFIQKNIYKKLFWINHWHHPQPYTRHTLDSVYATYSKEMIDTSNHKFRSSKDITPYLYRYWHLVKGDFYPYFHNDGLVVKISSLKYLQSIITHINQSDTINFVCFNDQMSDVNQDEFNQIIVVLEKHLSSTFPQKASFEV